MEDEMLFMEREYCIYKGERTLYPVAKINNYRSEKGTKTSKRNNGWRVRGFLATGKSVQIGENQQTDVWKRVEGKKKIYWKKV